jgi:DNA-binding HxlR family transcriptional regulator
MFSEAVLPILNVPFFLVLSINNSYFCTCKIQVLKYRNATCNIQVLLKKLIMLKNRSDCPISCSLEIFGDKWTLLILRDIMLRGKTSYGEFLESEEKISTNILADRLNLLESEGILSKQVPPENKSKYIYRLTKKGIDLLPIIIEIMDWGATYNENCPRKEVGNRIKENKADVIEEYLKKLKKRSRVIKFSS